MWKLPWKRARWRHQNKPGRRAAARYFGKFSKSRDDHWVSADRDSGGYLVKFSWTGIERHTPVKGTASPDDPALAGYRARRRTKVRPPPDKRTPRLPTRQAGLCPLCGDHLLSSGQPPQSPAQWERWWLHVTRKAIAAGYLACYGMPSPPDGDRTSLVHVSCQRRKPEPQLQPETPPQLA
jgi:RNA-directed DNA polymerase